jgi:hypothetical protein
MRIRTRTDPGRRGTGSVAPMTVPAFKEWAVIVRALLEGEQILDVRKGGLREDGRRFGVRADRCWLYPTYEHQKPELLKPAYRRWVSDTEHTSEAATVQISGWADVAGVITITDPDELARLDSKLIWTHEYAASRLGWKARQPLWVLALRAYQLEAPCTVAYRDEYGGCTSWVEMDGLPDDPTTLAAEPALTDETFAARLTLVEKELGRSFEPPAADQDSGDSSSSA